MRIYDFVSVKLCLCLISGILLGYCMQPNVLWIFIFLVVVLGLLVFARRTQKRNAFPLFGVLSYLTTMLLGVLIISLHLPRNQPHHFCNSYGQTAKAVLKISEVLKPNSYSNRYFAEVKSISNNISAGKVIVYVARDSLSKPLLVDDELLTYVKIDTLRPPLNPNQFDYRDYLHKNGIYGQIRLHDGQWIKSNTPRPTVFGLAAQFRDHLISKLRTQEFGKNELGVIQALLLGQRNDISEETYSNYRNAGAVHILAVSGLHVGILLLLLEFILKPLERLRKGKTLKMLLIISILWGFALIAGFSASIVRAVTMFSFLAYAIHLNRPTNSFNVLAWSMFFILLLRPHFVFQVGFQMSYAAVFAIVWIYPKLQRWWYPKTWVIRKIWQLLSVSVAAQLGVLPLSLFYFHQFPALFFVSNLIIVPFLGIILGMGILVLGLTYFDVIPSFLVSIYNGLIRLMNDIISWVAKQETFFFTDIPFDGIQLVLGYILILGLVRVFSMYNFKNLSVLLSALVLFSGYMVIVKWSAQSEEELWLFHQTRNTILIHHKGDKLHIFTKDSILAHRSITSYTTAHRIDSIAYDSIKNHYLLNSKKLMVLDSTGIYGGIKNPDYVVLTQSPKIHFERFLDSVQPKTVLADGSNYRSYIKRWEQSCRKRKLPFHYTGEKGSYAFLISD